jgi:hypothetical protein
MLIGWEEYNYLIDCTAVQLGAHYYKSDGKGHFQLYECFLNVLLV